MTKYTLLLAGLACAAFGSAPVQAQPIGPPPMHGPEAHGRMMDGDSPAMMLHMLLRQANLTPDQQTQVRKIMEADRQTLHTLLSQLQTANDQLADKLFAPGNVQAADVMPQVQQITQLRQLLMQQGVKTTLAIRAVLTPDQLTKVSQLKDHVEKLQAEMRNLFSGGD